MSHVLLKPVSLLALRIDWMVSAWCWFSARSGGEFRAQLNACGGAIL